MDEIAKKGIIVKSEKTFELVIRLHRPFAEWLLTYMREPKSPDEPITDKDLRETLYNKIAVELR